MYVSFHGWFAASLTVFLRGVLDLALQDLSQPTNSLDSATISLRQYIEHFSGWQVR